MYKTYRLAQGWLSSWSPWRASVGVYCLLSYLAQKNSALPYRYWHDAKHTTQYFMLFTSFDTVYTTIHQTYMFRNLIPCTKKHCKTIIDRSMKIKNYFTLMSLSKIEEPFKISLASVYIYVHLYIYIIIGIWVKLS